MSGLPVYPSATGSPNFPVVLAIPLFSFIHFLGSPTVAESKLTVSRYYLDLVSLCPVLPLASLNISQWDTGVIPSQLPNSLREGSPRLDTARLAPMTVCRAPIQVFPALCYPSSKMAFLIEILSVTVRDAKFLHWGRGIEVRERR